VILASALFLAGVSSKLGRRPAGVIVITLASAVTLYGLGHIAVDPIY
jgi:hypothetical protein